MNYRINYSENGQNSVNFMDVTDEDYEFPSFLNYDEVLEHSINEGLIDSEKEIVSLCDGCDEYHAYFSAITAYENCFDELESYGIDLVEDQYEYDAF